MHILAIDDEQSALNVLVGAIKEAVPHATVHGFRNPLEAFGFMKETKCEVAFLDIQMREMSGIVLARKLKEIYPKVNLVFVTGYSQNKKSLKASQLCPYPSGKPKASFILGWILPTCSHPVKSTITVLSIIILFLLTNHLIIFHKTII